MSTEPAARLAAFVAQQRGEAPSGVERCRRIPITLPLSAPEPALWEAHAEAMARLDAGHTEPLPRATSLLELKVELAWRLLQPCRQCFLRCEVNRQAGELGRCDLGPELRVYGEFLHYGEEPELGVTQAVMLSGCNFRCRFCTDWAHVTQPRRDPILEPAALARRIAARRRAGAHSLSMIGGLPDVNLWGILRALAALEVSVPLVWNSNMSASDETAALLAGLVDAQVADWKFGSDDCARRLAGVEAHAAQVPGRILEASARGYLIVRHLPMPGHLDCCTRPVLRELAERLPGSRLELLDPYLPQAQSADDPELGRRCEPGDLPAARALAAELGLTLAAPGPVLAKRPILMEERRVESQVTIGPDGEVVIETLSGPLLELARALGELDEGVGRGEEVGEGVEEDAGEDGACSQPQEPEGEPGESGQEPGW